MTENCDKITKDDILYFLKWFEKNYNNHQWFDKYKVNDVYWGKYIYYDFDYEYNDLFSGLYRYIDAFDEFVEEELILMDSIQYSLYNNGIDNAAADNIYNHWLKGGLKDQWSFLYDNYFEEMINAIDNGQYVCEEIKVSIIKDDVIKEIKRKIKEEGEKPYYIRDRSYNNDIYTFLFYFLKWLDNDFYSVKAIRRRKLKNII